MGCRESGLRWKAIIANIWILKLDLFFLAFFDGHSGSKCASYAATMLFKNFKMHVAQGCDIENALVAAFEKTHSEYLQEYADSGTTAVVVYIDNAANVMYVANVGDSRAVLAICTDEVLRAVPLSNDHKPNSEPDRARLTAANFEIKFNRGCWRLLSGLAVSRSIGDKVHLMHGLIATPEVVRYALTGEEKFIMLA